MRVERVTEGQKYGGVAESVEEEDRRKRGPVARLNNVSMREQVLAWDDETRSSVEL